MRATLLCAALLLVVGRPAAEPLAEYAAIVESYQSGDAESAVHRLVALDSLSIGSEFTAFMARPPAKLVAATAAIHTEIAVRLNPTRDFRTMDRHLRLATSIVEVGTSPRLQRYGTVKLKPDDVPPVTPEFRRIWYVLVITSLENAGRLPTAEAYLVNARILFPNDAEFLLLSGIAAELRASDRVARADAGDRRKALGYAEVYLRASLDLAPERLETKLRLGRVLQLRGHTAEARELLQAVADEKDDRIYYLASLFLGGLEDAAGHTDAAAHWYERASVRMPSAQAARLAASELRHRAGERQEAAAVISSAIGAANNADPFWPYLFGEYWRIDVYLKAMRKLSRA